MKTLHGLQYLRGLAAVAVVCFHATTRTGGGFLVGEAGVDLFFVLSGFLMIAITTAETRPLPFLRSRAIRIAPAYWIATSVCLAGGITGALPNLRLDAWHVASSYLFVPSRMPGSSEVWPLLVPGWTLNFEMFFYLLFALSLPAPRRALLPILTTLLVALVAIGAAVRPTGAITSFYTQPILLEFVAGAWMGLAWKRHGAPPFGRLLIAAAVLLYALAWRVDNDSLRVLTYGVPAALLLAGVLGVEHDGRLRPWPSLKLVGDASYSIYLWHTLVLSVTTKIGGTAHLPRGIVIALGIACGVGGGIVAYRWIEQPLNAMLKQRKTRLGVTIPSI